MFCFCCYHYNVVTNLTYHAEILLDIMCDKIAKNQQNKKNPKEQTLQINFIIVKIAVHKQGKIGNRNFFLLRSTISLTKINWFPD